MYSRRLCAVKTWVLTVTNFCQSSSTFNTESDNLSNIVQNHNRHSMNGDGYRYNFFSASRAHRSTRSAAASAIRKNKNLGQSKVNSVRAGGGIKTTDSFSKSKYGKGRALACELTRPTDLTTPASLTLFCTQHVDTSLCRILSTTCGQDLPLSVLARCCGLLYDGLSMSEPVENHLALSHAVTAGASTRETSTREASTRETSDEGPGPVFVHLSTKPNINVAQAILLRGAELIAGDHSGFSILVPPLLQACKALVVHRKLPSFATWTSESTHLVHAERKRKVGVGGFASSLHRAFSSHSIV